MTADLGREPGAVATMFDRLASRYDVTNDLLSFGQDRRWRRIVARVVDARTGERVLDLAAGTGTSSVPLQRAGADVIACDFSLGMLAVGRRRRPEVDFVAGDALRLPFADHSFDVVTISFGLRNTNDPGLALTDMLRVTRPGGRLVVCEFSHPTRPAFRRLYDGYLMRALPAIAQRVAANPPAYGYLAESIRDWPDQRQLAAQVNAAGWAEVAWRNLSGGIVAVHRARRPS